MSKVIKVENLSKAYQLGDFGTGTISRDLERFWARIRGKEDPFLRIGEVNDCTVKGVSDIVWSLKDINFEVNQGDAVGIIGRNGAGKSTLLKVLSRVTSPTTGSVKVKGRIASLLEVGTGFHPELTGRENIYLNGAILGMRKHEIKRKFDEIVDFSGVERYIDTPVKRYSSGMYVRLAFAVAAHLESEILIVDEVLAVGDAEFQKKCLGKMGDISGGEGRTVLFVSHNIKAIQTLCKSGIYLKDGLLKNIGTVNTIVDNYLQEISSNPFSLDRLKFSGPVAHKFKIKELLVNNIVASDNIETLSPNEAIEFSITYAYNQPNPYRLTLSLFFQGVRIFSLHDVNKPELPGHNNDIVSSFTLPPYLLRPGSYQLALGGFENEDQSYWFWNDNVYTFEVANDYSIIDIHNYGLINIENVICERI
jgi:lipopolysaccharide transport system ATP-binding protein